MEMFIQELMRQYAPVQCLELLRDRAVVHYFDFSKNIIPDQAFLYTDAKKGIANLTQRQLEELCKRISDYLGKDYSFEWKNDGQRGVFRMTARKEWETYRQEYKKFNRLVL